MKKTFWVFVAIPAKWLFFFSFVILQSCLFVQSLPKESLQTRVMDTRVRLNREGILESLTSQVVWMPLVGKNFPTRVIWPNFTPEPRPLTSFAVISPRLWTITTGLGAYLSQDQGASWSLVLQREEIARKAFLQCLAICPESPAFMAVGTSFSGLFLSYDGGKSWNLMDDFVSAFPYGEYHHEPVNALVFSQKWPHLLYISVGKDGRQLWRYDTKTRKAQPIAFPGGGFLTNADGLHIRVENEQEILEARTSQAWWRWDAPKDEGLQGTWTKLEDRKDYSSWDTAKRRRMEVSKDRLGYYLTAYSASTSKLPFYLNFMEEKGFNAVVVDFKNDLGEVMYESRVPLAQKISSIHPVVNVKELADAVHKRGFYLIARLVVFKDKKLYQHNNYEFALWDKSFQGPWRNLEKDTGEGVDETSFQKEHWVDMYHEAVWQYNIDLAKELQVLGVDEVQFDYIRFPSDGPLERIMPRYKKKGMEQLDALESFLKKARAELHLPLGVDIYGYNGYFVTDSLGQSMTMMSKYVDVISPMFYPSHFWKPFLWAIDYLERARIIYQDGSERTFSNTAGQVHVRPWVQAFLLGNERGFSKDKYVTYLNKQLEGVRNSPASGFLLWNSSNKYYMVMETIAPYRTVTKLPY